MADENANQPAQEGVKQPESSQDVKPETVPYSRFKEINDKLKDMETRELKRAEDDRAAKEKKLLEEKKYHELLETKAKELEDAKAEQTKLAAIAKQFKEQQDSIREAALAKIADEDLRHVASKLEDPTDILVFASKLEQSRVPPSGAKLSQGEKDANPFQKREGESMADYQRRTDALLANRTRSK